MELIEEEGKAPFAFLALRLPCSPDEVIEEFLTSRGYRLVDIDDEELASFRRQYFRASGFFCINRKRNGFAIFLGHGDWETFFETLPMLIYQMRGPIQLLVVKL